MTEVAGTGDEATEEVRSRDVAQSNLRISSVEKLWQHFGHCTIRSRHDNAHRLPNFAGEQPVVAHVRDFGVP